VIRREREIGSQDDDNEEESKLSNKPEDSYVKIINVINLERGEE
jgi:hypothetical protein